MRKKENSRAKLYRVVAIFILLGLSLSVVSYFGNKVQSGSRSYISGESEWSKAQKEVTITLLQYVRTEDQLFYNKYLQSLKVIEGDRIGREQLRLENVDYTRVREGFLQGNNHAEDVDVMIWLFRNFSDFEQIQNALTIWETADKMVGESTLLAEEIHRRVLYGNLDEAAKEEYATKILAYNDRLTVTGQNFSDAMSSAARRFGGYIFWLNVFLSTTFIIFAAYYSISYMRHLRGSNAKLARSEHKFRNVLDHSRDVIYQISIGSEQYDYMSSSVKDMLGLDAEEVMKGGPEMILQRVHPDDLGRMKKRQEQNRSENVEETIIQDSEFRVRRADGTYTWVNNKRAVVHDEDGNPVAIVGNVRDISVHKHQVEKLDQSLNEKQTLLAEIHHRVKNNLAIVSSLIELQKDEVDPELKPAFRNVQSRIKSIALIHEKLYENTIFSEVELADYLRELSEMISHTYHSKDNRVSIKLNLDDVKVDMTSAVPVGLICNELINNCFKHAFNECGEGIVAISLKDLDGYVEVTVTDNGDGLPDDFSLDSMQSLGVTLLTVLTKQIGGELRSVSDGGSQFVLTFPVQTEENKKAERKAV
ncbi:sensor histidine kinase [Rhodohalobacter sp. 8-1]|uniref:sensor histidine kinase n=1 Tax=Rhodohalobacter sp. 8-1 TaxID=3131972 RepID=UPI0030EB368F